MRLIDHTGKVFGRLTVLHRGASTRTRQTVWVCRCECGTVKPIQAGNLNSGHSTSCGECSGHGMSKTPTHVSWAAMNSRCRCPTNPNYPHYGARGISVCDRWRHSFKAFLADMGERPSLAHSIDRIDVNGNYEPGNCRWATESEQRKNQRFNIRGRLIEFNGRKLSIRNWAVLIGIPERTLGHRLRTGWSIEEALTKPVSEGRSRAAKISRAKHARMA